MLKGALPFRDSFVIASLIVLSNSFSPVHGDIDNKRSTQVALDLHQHLGKADPLAHRYHQIVAAFDDAVNSTASRCPNQAQNFSESIMNTFFGGNSSQSRQSQNYEQGSETAPETDFADNQSGDYSYQTGAIINAILPDNVNPDLGSMGSSAIFDTAGLFDAGASASGDCELDFNAFLRNVYENNPGYQIDPFYGMVGMM
ncbi:hypothetical protein ACEPPN_015230 [Leptodophora sp. 'Broadleaf-Isolate-01']